MSVYSSFIQNCQKLEASKMSFSKGMDKQTVVTILMLLSGLTPKGKCPLDLTNLATNLHSLVINMCFPKEYLFIILCVGSY